MTPVLGVARLRRLTLATVCAVLGLLVLGAAGGLAATPSSLAGPPKKETFTGLSGSISGACNADDSGSFTFSTSGAAIGPYNGTFTEEGSFTIANAHVTAFSSTFTITSPKGSVTGSKELSVSLDGLCVLGGSFEADSDTTYTATINGAFRDTGTAIVRLHGIPGLPLGAGFSELFDTSNGVTPIQPASDCKDGGWQNLDTMFKNQGDCISFVATGGKNPPSGSGRTR